jgi:O-antigen ligase
LILQTTDTEICEMERAAIATEITEVSQLRVVRWPRIVRWLDTFIFADLLTTAILSALAFGAVEPWSLAIFELNALVVVVVLALNFALDPRFDLRRLRLSLPVFVFLILGAIQAAQFGSPTVTNAPEGFARTTAALSLDPHATREAVVKLFALAVYFVAALHSLRDNRRRRISLLTLSVFGFAVSLFAIAQRLTYNGKMYWVRPVSDYIAPYGPYGNYNHFAGMVELILPLALAYLLVARTGAEQRALWCLAVMIMAVATVFSLSRGGMLALGAQVAVLLLVSSFLRGRGDKVESRSAKTKRRALIAFGIGGVIMLALWIGYAPLTQRFGTIGQGASEYSVVTRLSYWRASWRMFLDHPILGVGLGAFPAIYPAYGQSSARYERLEQAHNDYLQLLTDSGIVGAMIGLWFLFEIIRIARLQWRGLERFRSRSRATALGGYVAVFGLLIHSFTDFNLQITANALLFLLDIALATSLDPNEKQSYDNQ